VKPFSDIFRQKNDSLPGCKSKGLKRYHLTGWIFHKIPKGRNIFTVKGGNLQSYKGCIKNWVWAKTIASYMPYFYLLLT